MNSSIGFSTTQSVGNYPESSFTFQNKIYKNLEHCIIFFEKIELYEFKKQQLNE